MVIRDSVSRIYVGNLPSHVSSRDVENEFRKYGNIIKCDVKKTVSGAAFAFIEFEDARDAADAIKEKDGCDFEGNKLRVEVPFNARENGRYNSRGGGRGIMNRGPKSRRGRYVVEVTGLPLSGSWQDLKDHLRDAGECGHADVYKDGTGEVSFFNKADMLEAIDKFNGSIFRSHEGEKSKITVRQKKTSWRHDDGGYGRHSNRNRSYSRSSNRSYTRSYSRSRSRSSSSRSRSRSMDRRRDAYDKKRSYSSLSYQERRRNNRSISRSRSKSRTDSRSSSWSHKRRH